MTAAPAASRARVTGFAPAPGTAAVALLVLLAGGVPDSARGEATARLAVPIVTQRPERCGPAALAMVMRYYGADPATAARADSAYDPALHGTLVTDLAAQARRAGFAAEVVTLDTDSLARLVADGVPVIVLYQNGPLPLTVPHYGVVVGWDPGRRRFTLHDGGAVPRTLAAGDLARRWKRAGGQALLVRPAAGSGTSPGGGGR
ncbi:MAG TPA: C39 family peptidase [Candidatus Eisenbacteria bacterium]|nr:C39 family peptidase [Candidatus Eisenbacteria bacterium]